MSELRCTGWIAMTNFAHTERPRSMALTKEQMAQRIARELKDGYYVNLGIGIPTLVANYIPEGINVELQSENGILGMGPFPWEGEEDADGDANPLYRETLAFALELDDIFFDMPLNVQEHPATVTLQNQTSLAATKLAAALNDDDIDELGMRIAYLKRALHAINTSLDAVSHLREGNLIGAAEHERVRGSLFSIRDGVVSAMGEYRAEFRKRHGR